MAAINTIELRNSLRVRLLAYLQSTFCTKFPEKNDNKCACNLRRNKEMDRQNPKLSS